LLGTGDGNSLQNVNTTNLPNGAECYVIETNLSYRLHKTLTAPVAGAVSPASGPGVWLPDSNSGMFVNSAEASAGTVNANSVTSQSLVPAIPLLATDVLFPASLPPMVQGVSDQGIVVIPRIDDVTTPGTPRVSLEFINGTAGNITTQDDITYYFIVYRPVA
jgi:hypothetical protein